MRKWQLQDAKARLSEVVKRAASEGPQEITLRGEPEAVLMSRADYDRAVGKKPSLVRFMQDSPLRDVELDLARDRSLTRAVDL
jgi:prevent-host-death family protein